MPLRNLSKLPFVHLFSDSDIDFQHELMAQTIPTKAAGFSECVSETTPAISLGWGWYVHSHSNCLLLAPDAVRSNVMLVDRHGYDVGPGVTSGMLAAWLTIFDWQVWVRATLCGGAL